MFERSFEIRTGYSGPHWFVEVRPPLTTEEMAALDPSVMHGWAVEDSEKTTLFRKHTRASGTATYEAAYRLGSELVAKGTIVDPRQPRDHIDMDILQITSLFDAPQVIYAD